MKIILMVILLMLLAGASAREVEMPREYYGDWCLGNVAPGKQVVTFDQFDNCARPSFKLDPKGYSGKGYACTFTKVRELTGVAYHTVARCRAGKISYTENLVIQMILIDEKFHLMATLLDPHYGE